MQDYSCPIIGICDKCGTENSELFQYKNGYYICQANECWTEEVERNSGRHIRLNKKLERLRKTLSHAL